MYFVAGTMWTVKNYLVLFVIANVEAKEQDAPFTTGLFCPLQGTLPKCEEEFIESNMSAYFKNVDTFISLQGVLNNRTIIEMFCQNLPSYASILDCAEPGLYTCRPKGYVENNLVPNASNIINTLEFMCVHKADAYCPPDHLASTETAIEECSKDAYGKAVFNGTEGGVSKQEMVSRLCSMFDELAGCLSSIEPACDKKFSDILEHIWAGMTPPGCASISSTTTSSSSSEPVSRLYTLIAVMLLMFAYLHGK